MHNQTRCTPEEAAILATISDHPNETPETLYTKRAEAENTRSGRGLSYVGVFRVSDGTQLETFLVLAESPFGRVEKARPFVPVNFG